jgi:hypothetical protein
MKPERADELAVRIRADYALSRGAAEAIKQAIIQACAEQRETDAGIAENEGCDQSEYRCATVERIAAAIRGQT